MELNRPFFKEPGSCGCHRAAQHDGAAFARSGEGLDVWHLKNLKTEQEKRQVQWTIIMCHISY